MAAEECELLCLDLPRAEAVRAVLPPVGVARGASERARALADPTRLRVAAALSAGGELCVCDLAWVCGLAQNLVSHHVRQLRVADLAVSRRDGRLVMYRLTEAGQALLAAVIASRKSLEGAVGAMSGPPPASAVPPRPLVAGVS